MRTSPAPTGPSLSWKTTYQTSGRGLELGERSVGAAAGRVVPVPRQGTAIPASRGSEGRSRPDWPRMQFGLIPSWSPVTGCKLQDRDQSLARPKEIVLQKLDLQFRLDHLQLSYTWVDRAYEDHAIADRTGLLVLLRRSCCNQKDLQSSVWTTRHSGSTGRPQRTRPRCGRCPRPVPPYAPVDWPTCSPTTA